VFNKKIVEPLPKYPTRERIVTWFRNAKESIETAETLQRGIQLVTPLLTFLLATLTK
jgi:hypothetical protein